MRGLDRAFPLNLAGLTLGISTLAVFYGGVRAFYYGGGFLESFSYYSDETVFNEIVNSWIGRDPAETLFGVHAFGDYLLASVWSTFPDPWGQMEQVNYLPPVLLGFRILSFLPHNVALGFYMAALAAATAAPMILATRRMALGTRGLLVCSLAILTGPAIATFDRANIQGLLPIILFGFALAVLRERWGWASVLVAIATCIKIYPIVLVLLLLALRKYKASAVAVGLAVGSVLVTLPIMSTAGLGGLPVMIGDVLQFQERTVEDFLQYNITLVGGLANLASFLGASSIGVWLASHALVVIAIYAICVIPLLWIRSIEIWIRIILVMSLTTSLMPIIYAYSLNWLLAASALAVWVSQRSSSHVEQPRLVSQALMLALAGGSAVLPILIPGTMESGRPAGIVSFASLIVALLIPGVAALSWWMLRRGNRVLPVATNGNRQS